MSCPVPRLPSIRTRPESADTRPVAVPGVLRVPPPVVPAGRDRRVARQRTAKLCAACILKHCSATLIVLAISAIESASGPGRSMKFKDYYKIMGLSRDASADEIKRAYRKLARKYHPDVSKEPQAEERFKELGEAYEVLRDTEKRAAYDHLGASWQPGQDFTPPPNWQGGGFEFHQGAADPAANHHFSDFFESLFGHAFHAGAGATGAGPRTRGQDQHSKITISLDDAYHGATRIIQLAVPEWDATGSRVMRNHALQVQIPHGVVQGQQIRLAGQGAAGAGGGPRGDLYLEVQLQPHPLFKSEGHDIYLNLPLTPWEAALGAQLTVPTLGGNVEVKIPAGSQSGQKLRLKGRGLGSKTRGDQYIVLQIVAPPAMTPAAREFYERMSRELPFNPRSHMGV